MNNLEKSGKVFEDFGVAGEQAVWGQRQEIGQGKEAVSETEVPQEPR